MNVKLVFRITGLALLLQAGAMLPPLLVCLRYGEDPAPFLWTIALLLLLGLPLTLLLRNDTRMYARDAYLAVGLIWLLFSLFGALPFYFSGRFGGFVDCLFEATSGFTTTGATVLRAVEGLPMGQLFWRSFTHWLGGMGVLILTTALMPFLGISSNHLIRAESPGPVKSKLVPRASNSSKILYSIYLGLTLVQVVALRMVGMPWFDAVVNAFATAGTGGFSIRNTSIAAYHNPAAEVVLTVFMLLFPLNFALYFLLLTGRVKQVLKSDELRFFLGVVGVSTLAIAWNTASRFDSLWTTLRTAAFQVASIISSTGFATVDYDAWPQFSRLVLMMLMFIGSCAASTGGGMKCSRILVLLRSARREIATIVHPRSVSVVRLDGVPLSEEVLRTTHCYFFLYFLTVGAAALLVSFDNFSFGTTVTAVIACVSNIGPGLETVGPMGNFAPFSDLSKVVFSICMVIGRLEMFPIFVLFSRSSWKHT